MKKITSLQMLQKMNQHNFSYFATYCRTFVFITFLYSSPVTSIFLNVGPPIRTSFWLLSMVYISVCLHTITYFKFPAWPLRAASMYKTGCKPVLLKVIMAIYCWKMIVAWINSMNTWMNEWMVYYCLQLDLNSGPPDPRCSNLDCSTILDPLLLLSLSAKDNNSKKNKRSIVPTILSVS